MMGPWMMANFAGSEEAWGWMQEMMSPYQSGFGYWFWQLQWWVVWALIVAFLAAAVRWLWKKGNK